jgi:hypothetical protein
MNGPKDPIELGTMRRRRVVTAINGATSDTVARARYRVQARLLRLSLIYRRFSLVVASYGRRAIVAAAYPTT